jgi:hypothetical protein
MRNSILIEISNVDINDFDNQLPAPEFIESMADGVRILFYDIDALQQYQDRLLTGDGDKEEGTAHNDIKNRVNDELIKALDENQVVLDSIKAYAKALFQFIFKREGHRQDKLVILDDMLAGMQETTNNLELEQAVKDATYELGTVLLNHNLTFNTYAHNDVDYNFEYIKNQLIKDLNALKTGLVY